MKMEDITAKALQSAGLLKGTLADLAIDMKPDNYTRVKLVIDIPNQQEFDFEESAN